MTYKLTITIPDGEELDFAVAALEDSSLSGKALETIEITAVRG